MEIGPIGMLFIGFDRGNTGIVVNTAVAIALTQLPPVLKRNYENTMEVFLTRFAVR